MATTKNITFACGHSESRDLSSKRPAERAGYANWLATKDCTDCFKAGNSEERQAFFEAQRVEREAWEQRGGWPALQGAEKSLRWGAESRYRLIKRVIDEIDYTEEELEAEVIAPAKLVTSASWWIDQRDEEPEDVAELVQDWEPRPTEILSENPYS